MDAIPRQNEPRAAASGWSGVPRSLTVAARLGGFSLRCAVLVLAGWGGGRVCGQPVPVEALYVETRGSNRDAPQAPGDNPLRKKNGDGAEVDIPLTPPTPEQLFQLRSEGQFLEAIRAEGEQKGVRFVFPPNATVEPSPAFSSRGSRPAAAGLPVAPVCHGPLYFEDRNTERYGWNVPCVQPLLSAGKFYFDVLTLPYKVVRHPPCYPECNTGLPLPGDPVPYSLRPTLPGWSLHLAWPDLDF